MIAITVRLLLAVVLSLNCISCFNTDTASSNNTSPSAAFYIKGISMVAPVEAIDSGALLPILNSYANSIAVMPYAFCSTENPEIKYNHKGQWWGESDEGVIGSIELAHQKKLSVMLKPHLWIGDGIYTGEFTLTSEKEWQVWENSYQEYMLHFAALGDSMQVDILCIATELGTSIKERPQFWNTFIDTLKKVYHGKLSYAANWDDYKYVPFWQKLDYIGVDAYFPLSTEKSPSKESLQKGWIKYTGELEKISSKYKRPILFTEYGYRNVDYTAAEPWKENEGDQNDQGQATAYEALYESLKGKSWFAGGYVWKWYIENTRHRNRDIDYTPQERPALKVIEKWYRN